MHNRNRLKRVIFRHECRSIAEWVECFHQLAELDKADLCKLSSNRSVERRARRR